MSPRAATLRAPAIRFGTSGWRGLLADDFTFERVRAAVHAVGCWLAANGPGARVLVAHDRRFLGESLVALAVRVLEATGARPFVARGPVATPVADHAVRRLRVAAALVFTASHNPPEYQGLKLIGASGGGLAESQTRRIEALAAAALARGAIPEGAGRPRRVDLVSPYLKELLAELDGDALRRARLDVVYDALHGCGAGVLDTALRSLGARVLTLNAHDDPRFGGAAPDPVPGRLTDLRRRLARGRGLRLGLATDGDADRYGVVDADGRVLSETQALALLVDHLATTRRLRRGVAISIATGSLVERVAGHHGLSVTKHPIGFKHLSRALANGAADVAGEESGGFALGRFGRDKDGILAAGLLAELVAVQRAPLRMRLAELERSFGPCACGRIAIPAGPATHEALARLEADAPSRVGVATVREVGFEDGLRLRFDDGFLMLRASGTEPVLRVYAEASTPRALAQRLRAGARLLSDSRRRVSAAARRERRVDVSGAHGYSAASRGILKAFSDPGVRSKAPADASQARSRRVSGRKRASGKSRSGPRKGPGKAKRKIEGMEARRILIAVTGGIAAYKAPELVRQLCRAGCDVRCALTPEAARFVTPLVLQTLSGRAVRSELFDASEEGEIDHIALADWAEAVVVAPATAHVLARMAHGLADDLVTTLLLATRAPVLAAPAMNVNMWRHPATQENVERLRERGVRFVGPESGALACGWEGEGRMADPAAIAAEVELLLGPGSLASEVVLVTAGGTREPIDAVRSITNRSSGKMGFAVAAEAARRGAEVVLVAGPSVLATPAGVRRIDVETALEMRDAVRAELARASVVIMAAAVADFRPASPTAGKLRKQDLAPGAGLTLELVRNPDILEEVGREKGARIVVGFAAESGDLVESARRKLAAKGCDLMLANDVTREAAGFDVDTNAVVFVWPGGEVEELALLPKREVAARLLDRVEKLRGARG